MKRIILIIGALLMGIAVRAQSVGYAFCYWFDQNHTQAVTTTFSDSIWQAQLDIGSLSEGVHTLHLHILAADTVSVLNLEGDSLYHAMDTAIMKWSAPQSYYFIKINDTPAEELAYHCWFDEDFAHQQTDTLGSGHLFLDVADLEEGMHTVHVLVEGSTLTATQSYMFMKAEIFSVDTLDMSHLVYHCWFDQDFEHRVTDSLGEGSFLLDVSDLEDGLHSVHVILEGSALTTTQSYMFMKMPVENPSTELQYHCWFDRDYDNVQTGLLGSGIFELEVDGLSNGIHTVNVLLDNGTLTAPQTYLFYKIPLGGNGIARWEYWLNGDYSNRTVTNVSPVMDTLDIISLLPVGHPAIRSSCFHFNPNGEEPYINAKNQISFRIWDAEMRFMDMTRFYVDEQVQQEIVAQVFEHNTTETFAAPRDNQITWFKLDAVVGDSLSFVASKACTMQLFAPSGEEVLNVSGPESITLHGLHAWEDGTYYLAVHDVTGNGETLSVTYQYVHKYAILAYDVHLVGNGGCSTITFLGNGFNSLLDAYLVNYQNDTIHHLDIGHESNTTTTVTFNFYEVNLGVYDAVFQFYGEIVRINGALEVQEPVDILLTSSVSYSRQFLRNTPCTYTYTFTNNGNMTAYNVPLNIYIICVTKKGISRLSTEGFQLDKLYDFIKDSYEWSEQERNNLITYSNYIGEDIYFLRACDVDEMTGDSVYIRSGLIMTAIPPNTTKTITVSLTSSEPIETWVNHPTEWFAYTEQNYGSGNSDFCCNIEEFGDAANNASIALGAGAIMAQVAAAALGATGVGAAAIPFIEAGASFAGVASCATGLLSGAASAMDMLFCSDNNLTPRDFGMSALGIVAGCTSAWGEVMETVRTALQYGGSLASLGAGIMSSKHNTKNPNCPGDHKGGKSTPVNSIDPNDIYGYLSESGSHYMRQEIQNVQYEIEFENDTVLATAAAHTIIVRDTLDATRFDLNSLAARSVTIGSKRLDLNGEQTFARTLDLRPEIYVIAQINQDYDPTTGIIQWTIQSLDPMTMEPTDDPNQGVLPVNYYGDGVGFIDYSIDIKEPFADGTEISNRAGIIFDQNDVIMTPTWTNIVDAVKPTSHIEEVTLMGDSLNFNFVSSDNRSGVWYHSLYYRNASTELEWLVKKAQILGNSFMLPFDSLQTTEYFVIAVDSAGNVEAMKTEAEVVVESSVSGYPFFVAGYGESTNAGWKFIASPVEGSIEAATVDNIFGATQSDLYYFDQGEESEWRNYKSAPFELENGKGYLYATKEDKTLIFRGAYNEADAYEVPLVYTGANPHTDMRGWNLIGNPFTVPAYVDRSYYTMNEDGTAIEPVAVSEGTPIPACHGVMVKAETPDETVTFSRTAQQTAPNQGNIQIAVAQATMRVDIKQDKAVVSFNPNDQLGKFDFNESNAKVYIPQDGKDYAIAYAAKTGEIPVNFKAAKNGEYTMNVNTNGMEFNYLHLIDNLTGADVDLLPLCKGDEGGFNEPQQATYTFTAKTTDYASRFKLVFSVCGDADGDNAPFAFINNGNIIIVGAEAGSTLQIVDVLGRVLVCRDASHVSAISTTGMTKGVYVLRLINGDDVKTQKIVIQ